MPRLRRRSAPDPDDPEPLCHIDFPPRDAWVAPGWSLVRGWVALPSHDGGERLTLRRADTAVALRQEARPDVVDQFPQREVIGFREFVRVTTGDADRHADVWTLEVATDDRTYTFDLPFSVGDVGSGPTEIPFEWALDSPRDAPEPALHSVLVRGWIVVPPQASLEGVFVDCGARVPLGFEERADVAQEYPDDRVVGFRGLVELTPSTTDRQWSLEVVVEECSSQAALPVTVPAKYRDDFFRRKAAKLERIEPILRCSRPLTEASAGSRSCGGDLERIESNRLRCVECGSSYAAGATNFDFLTPELRELSATRATDNISCLPYRGELCGFVEEYADGLVLDNGSGLRDVYHDNVVNLEIVDHLTTDVLGVGEHLPFADAAFDAVISIAVLEHVRDPFACAAEIARVVKPGGRIFVEVPFLQPYHGYPHHYYNMTRSGLENLFADQFVIERSGIPADRGGEPIFTLPWLLGLYVAGLPPAAAERFKQLTVDDLLADGSTFLREDFVTDLDPETAETLAHVTYVVGRRR